MVARGLRAPVPFTLITKMLYHERVNLTPDAIGASGVHVFSANGTYDPNITGIGHQPRGFDQMMALYDHNVVIYSKCRVDFASATVGANINPGICSISVRDFTTTGTNAVDYIELSNTVWKMNNPADQPVKLQMSINPNKYLGRTSPLSDSQLKNSDSGNCVEQCYWHVAYHYGSGLQPSAIAASVTIEYTVVFLEPKDPGIS